MNWVSALTRFKGGTTGLEPNELATAYSAAVKECLGEKALPGDFGRALQSDDTRLYVPEREASPYQSDEIRLEHSFHNIFTRAIPPLPPLIILRGEEGVGKSTFLRYYFDFFLSAKYSLDARSPTLLVFYSDLRRGTTWPSIEEQIYQDIRKELRRRFPEITVENDYAMWARKVSWDDPIHVSAEQSHASRAAYRGNLVGQYFLDDRVFVQEALWYLATRDHANDEPTFNLVFIADNADQLPFNVQEDLIKLILRFAEQKADLLNDSSRRLFWRLIISLRPESFGRLSHALRPVTDHTVVDVSMPLQKRVLSARTEYLAESIRTTRTQVDRVFSEKDTGFVVYAPLTSAEVAKHLKRVIGLEDIVFSMGQSPIDIGVEAQRFLTDFANNSLRRLLRLRRQIALNRGLAEQLRGLKRWRSGSFAIAIYRLYDAMIVGPHDFFDKNDEESDMMNIFDVAATQRPRTYKSLLSGFHFLSLLTRRAFSSQEITKILTSLGHSPEDIEDCLVLFFNKGLYKPGVVDKGESFLLHPQAGICSCFNVLVEHPAYIDNMAMVTPIDDRFVDRIMLTVSYMPSEFRSRAQSTLAFLHQLREAESAFCTWSSDASNLGPEEFRSELNRLHLPSIYSRAACNYRERLEGLRISPKSLTNVMSEANWNELLEDEVLTLSSRRRNEYLRARLYNESEKHLRFP